MRRPTLTLTAAQRQAVTDTADALDPVMKHGFLLRVGTKLEVHACTSGGHVTNNLVADVVENVLKELGAS